MTATMMRIEAEEAPSAVERFLRVNREAVLRLGETLRATPPPLVVNCARGSSDHAATYAKYLIESKTGVVTASASPSVTTLIGGHAPAVRGALCIAISQSGRSPDLIETVLAHREAGAHVVALVNDTASPLFDLANTPLPMMAGEERSVAATKTFIVSLAGLAAIVGAWASDATLDRHLEALPTDLERAIAADWSSGMEMVGEGAGLFVIARGFALAAAQEAALKLKETCGLQAEAYSSAEVRHGPMRIVERGFPILALATSDAAGADVAEVAALFADRGARTTSVGGTGEHSLPVPPTCPELEPLLMIQSFYGLAEALALSRELDPDRPPHLRKVTSTR